MITNSGANQFHGAALEQFQNNSLSTHGEFDPAAIAIFRSNQFWATRWPDDPQPNLFLYLI